MRRILFAILAFVCVAFACVSCDTKPRSTPQMYNVSQLVRTRSVTVLDTVSLQDTVIFVQDTISLQDTLNVGDTVRMTLFANGLYNYLNALAVAANSDVNVSLEWSDELADCLASDADPAKGRLLFVAEKVYAFTTVLRYIPLRSGKYRIDMQLSSDAGEPYSPAQYYFEINVR